MKNSKKILSVLAIITTIGSQSVNHAWASPIDPGAEHSLEHNNQGDCDDDQGPHGPPPPHFTREDGEDHRGPQEQSGQPPYDGHRPPPPPPAPYGDEDQGPPRHHHRHPGPCHYHGPRNDHNPQDYQHEPQDSQHDSHGPEEN